MAATAAGAMATGAVAGFAAHTAADTVATVHPATPPEPAAHVVPVAFAVRDQDRTAATEERVASVEKAGRLAAQLAELHARQQTASVIAVGGLDGWIAEALQTMQLPQAFAPSVKRIILAESGGNPRAINRWDSNARRGTPSRGLMQTVPATFRAYVHPDLSARPIVDPVANITAGVRYMIDRYGMETLEAGGRTDARGRYVGY
ncbi:MAG: Lytic transglycosylase catalytic [Pseudonocardia sp.]|nr:Lytic transglycosylase catalytic [Pseudonocardia sp.]